MGLVMGVDGLFADAIYHTFSGSQNNLSPVGLADASILILHNVTGSAVDITGIDASGGGLAMRGRLLWVILTGSPINIRHNSGSSLAANRILTANGADPGNTAQSGSIGLIHDTSNWLQFSGS